MMSTNFQRLTWYKLEGSRLELNKKEELEDTKGVIRIEGQTTQCTEEKGHNLTNNDLQNTTQKTQDWATQTLQNTTQETQD